jgi:hypothetical protein
VVAIVKKNLGGKVILSCKSKEERELGRENIFESRTKRGDEPAGMHVPADPDLFPLQQNCNIVPIDALNSHAESAAGHRLYGIAQFLPNEGLALF